MYLFYSAKHIALCLLLTIVLVIPAIKANKVKELPLNSNWMLFNQNGSIQISGLNVPNGVFTALRKHFGEVLQEKNDEKLNWISQENWIFQTKFRLSPFLRNELVNLTLLGVDTFAAIYLNGIHLGDIDDMFVRHSFEVENYLQNSNILRIEIKSPLSFAEKEFCHFPASSNSRHCNKTFQKPQIINLVDNADYPSISSMGIWKPVLLEFYEVAILREVSVNVVSTVNKNWSLKIRLFLDFPTRFKFYAQATFMSTEFLETPLLLPIYLMSSLNPVYEFSVNVSKDNVSLWWPNGYGSQNLYPAYVSINCWRYPSQPQVMARTTSEKRFQIAFRTIELVEENDEFGRNFYFKINNQSLFLKGANYLPLDILPELTNRRSKIEYLLRAAKNSHLNMLRVGFSGFFENDYFYELANRFGLLIWHEITYSAKNSCNSKNLCNIMKEKLQKSVQHLLQHPSVALIVWNNGNKRWLLDINKYFQIISLLEKDYQKFFCNVLNQSINAEITKASSETCAKNPFFKDSSHHKCSKETYCGESDFWNPNIDTWNPSVYPPIRFVSAYGSRSLPIILSWNRTILQWDHLHLWSIIKHRQKQPMATLLPLVRLISQHFILSNINFNTSLEALIYFSQISQAIALKTATDTFRSQRRYQRTMGALYWQLNDVWVANTASTIDFYGNYKISYYWSKQFMAPISIIIRMDYLKSCLNYTITHEENITSRKNNFHQYTLQINLRRWNSLFYKKTFNYHLNLVPNGIRTDSIKLSELFPSFRLRQEYFLEFFLWKNNRVLIAQNYWHVEKISTAMGLENPDIKLTLFEQYCSKVAKNNKKVSYSLTVSIRKPAMYVFLEIRSKKVSNYIFSENGFIQSEPSKSIFLEVNPVQSRSCLNLTTEDIYISTINQYILPNYVAT